MTVDTHLSLASQGPCPAGSEIVCPTCNDSIGFVRKTIEPGAINWHENILLQPHQLLEYGAPMLCACCGSPWSIINPEGNVAGFMLRGIAPGEGGEFFGG